MGTIITRSILAKAGIILNDVGNDRWTMDELLGWLNDGQRAIVTLVPSANTVREVVALTAGTRQSIPANGLLLIDVPRNMGTNGTTPGRAVRLVTREILDATNPDWHSSTPSTRVIHYTYSKNEPKAFYVFPPQPATGSTGRVEIVYGAIPLDTALDGPISVDDVYSGALLDYVLHRAFSKESEFADSGRATAHFNAYAFAVTGKAKGEDAMSPNVAAPSNPNLSPPR